MQAFFENPKSIMTEFSSKKNLYTNSIIILYIKLSMIDFNPIAAELLLTNQDNVLIRLLAVMRPGKSKHTKKAPSGNPEEAI